MIHIADSEAKPHRKLEEEQREDRDKNQWVPFTFYLDRQAAQTLGLLSGRHALNHEIAEEHRPQTK